MGPIQAMIVSPTSRNISSGDENKSTKFRTVDELVKEMMSMA